MSTAVGAPILTRAFGLLMIAHFLQALGFSSMVLLPVYLNHLQADRAEIGFIMGLASVGSLAFRPIVAWALDSFGRRPTLFIGTAVLSAGMVTFATVSEVGMGVYMARLLTGVGTGTLFTGYFALAADLVPVDRRTQGIAVFGISGLVPLVVNPVAEGVGVAAADIGTFFALLGGLIMASLVPLAFIREPDKAPAPEAAPLSLATVFVALRAAPVRPVWWATIVLSGLVSSFFAFSTVAAASRGVQYPSILWLTYAAGAVGVRVLYAFLPHQVAPRRFLPPAFLLYACASALMAITASDLGLAVAGFAAGLGHGLAFPVLVSQVASRMPDHLRGSGMAGFTALWELAALFVTPMLGAVADAVGDGRMFAIAAVGTLAGLAVWWPMEKRYGPAGEIA